MQCIAYRDERNQRSQYGLLLFIVKIKGETEREIVTREWLNIQVWRTRERERTKARGRVRGVEGYVQDNDDGGGGGNDG